MERNVTSIMHFLLEDATHGHTWPRVREEMDRKRMRINGVLAVEREKEVAK